MIVKFANVDGIVMDYFRFYRSYESSLYLGDAKFTQDALIITDRTSRDEYTRLFVTDIIKLIRYAIKLNVYNNDEIIVHLPKMSPNLLKEAHIQEAFYNNLSNDNKSQVKLLNI